MIGSRPPLSRTAVALVATALLLGSALASGVVAEALPPSTAVDLTGTLEVAHADDFATAPVVYSWLRTDAGARFRLRGHVHGSNVGGSRVRVRGNRVAAASNTVEVTSIAAAAGDSQAAGGTQAAVAATVTKNIAVLLVNFTNDPSQPFTAAAATTRMFGATDSVKNFFEEESRGAVAVTGTVFNWRTINTTNAGCNWSTWGSLAQQGLNLSGYTNIVTVWPGTSSCGWAGLAYVPGTLSYLNGSMSLRVASHELGHNFNVMHASSLNCTSAGVRVSLSSTCTYGEYGDPFTVMGAANTYHNSALMIGQMGYLAASEVRTVTPGGSYTVAPVLTSPAGTVKLLRISRGNGTWFYIDVRSTYGTYFDNFAPGSAAVSGVIIRTSPDAPTPGYGLSNSMLVDAVPSSATFADAPLAVGQTITDPVSHISFTTVSIVGGVATVNITTGAPPPTPTPTPVPTPSPTPVPTPTPTPHPTPTPTPTPHPTPTPTPTPNPTPTPTPNPTPPPGSVAFVKVIGTASRSVSGNSTISISPTAGVVAGHSIVVAVSVGTFGGAVGCSDTKGNVYSVDSDQGGPGRLFICSARNVRALTSTDKITATYPGFSGSTIASASEFSGANSVMAHQSATGNNVSPTIAVTGPAGSLIVGAVAYASTPTFTAGCSMTQIGAVTTGSGSGQKWLIPMYRIVGAGGSYSSCGTLSFSRPWLAAITANH